ncbi:MAG: ABC-type transport auxiliary lipoprotein family protein [Gammaproteobacteria bacterium]
MSVRLPLCAVLLSVAACSVNLKRPPHPALHDFGPTSSDQNQTRAHWSAVSVDAPEWLQDQRIQYRLLYANPTQVRFYAFDRWLAPPSELLAQRLSVVGGGGRYSLRIQFQQLEQVFDRPGNAHVVMAFRANVSDPDADRPAGERVFRLRQATRTPNAAGAVDAFSRVIDRAITMLSDWSTELDTSR